MAARKSTTDPAPLVGAGLGRIAYDAHSAAVSGTSVLWEDLPHDVAAAWCAAAQAVITATIERSA